MNTTNNSKMYKTLIQWKWTKGEPYDRSKRPTKEVNEEQFSKEIETSAYQTSLNHDENTWDLMNKNFVSFNKREDTDMKLSERQMVCQINMNPYLTNNSYVDDLSVHDQFLKPISTNFGRENVENNDK